MSTEKKTTEQILLEPLNMPIEPIVITTPLKKDCTCNELERGKYGSLFSTKVDSMAFTPSRKSLTFFVFTENKQF